MNCYNHSSLTAVASCGDCGKGLCNECVDFYDIPICDNCNHKRAKEIKWSLIKEIMLPFIWGALITFILYKINSAQHVNSSEYIKNMDIAILPFAFIAMSGMIAGWKWLSSITPAFILSANYVVWGIYLFIKFWLSILVGVVVLPIRLVTNIIKIRQASRMQKVRVTT